MSKWLRLNAEWEESAWLMAISGHASGCWPRLLSWVKMRGKKGRVKEPARAVLADRWKVPLETVNELMDAALAEGAKGDADPGGIRIEGGELVVVQWLTWNPDDPKAAQRKRDQRERDKLSESHGQSRTVTDSHAVTLSRDARRLTETASPDGDARTRARAEEREAGREPGSSLDPERPWEGLDDLTVASLRGLYGGPGRVGTDEAVWRHANGIDRELALKTALIRWRGENHARLNQRLFRKILEAVITEQSQHSPTEKLWT